MVGLLAPGATAQVRPEEPQPHRGGVGQLPEGHRHGVLGHLGPGRAGPGDRPHGCGGVEDGEHPGGATELLQLPDEDLDVGPAGGRDQGPGRRVRGRPGRGLGGLPLRRPEAVEDRGVATRALEQAHDALDRRGVRPRSPLRGVHPDHRVVQAGLGPRRPDGHSGGADGPARLLEHLLLAGRDQRGVLAAAVQQGERRGGVGDGALPHRRRGRAQGVAAGLPLSDRGLQGEQDVDPGGAVGQVGQRDRTTGAQHLRPRRSGRGPAGGAGHLRAGGHHQRAGDEGPQVGEGDVVAGRVGHGPAEPHGGVRDPQVRQPVGGGGPRVVAQPGRGLRRRLGQHVHLRADPRAERGPGLLGRHPSHRGGQGGVHDDPHRPGPGAPCGRRLVPVLPGLPEQAHGHGDRRHQEQHDHEHGEHRQPAVPAGEPAAPAALVDGGHPGRGGGGVDRHPDVLPRPTRVPGCRDRPVRIPA